MSATVDGLNVWFNLTGSERCLDWNASAQEVSAPGASGVEETQLLAERIPANETERQICGSHELSDAWGWTAICCNQGLSMVNTLARGLGRDLYWPPTLPRNASLQNVLGGSMDYCEYFKHVGLFGLPAKPDVDGQWMDTLYGGRDIAMHSNIFFSNGDLDPWASGGVLPPGPSESLPAALIPRAGHHLDLFFSTDADSEPLRNVRALERSHILAWIAEAQAVHGWAIETRPSTTAEKAARMEHKEVVAWVCIAALAFALIALFTSWTRRIRKRVVSNSAVDVLRTSLIP